MQHIESGYRGLSVLMNINADRLLFPAYILAALAVGAFIGAQ